MKEKKIYGQWPGNPKGHIEDESRCIESVYPPDSFVDRQCRNKRGHGPDGLYCRIHARRK